MYWQWQPIIMLLLQSVRLLDAAPDCTNAAHTVVLSKTQVVRTWQPDGDCQRWQNGRSETNRFPAAVRSGPRWLVMQLRQPMVLDRVSVRGWDGQWQAAGAVGSPVSAVGAASLPLELQLEDPCRASWEAFGSSDRWRQLGGFEEDSLTPLAFIRLSSKEPLSWQALNITGRYPLLELRLNKSVQYLYRSYGLTVKQQVHKKIELFMDYCGSQRIVCWLLPDSGAKIYGTYLGNVSHEDRLTHKLELKFRKNDHGERLQCGLTERSVILFEELLLWEFPTKTVRAEISTVYVLGHPVIIKVSSDSFPEAEHRCFLKATRDYLALNRVTKSKATDAKNLVVVRVQSEFSFNLTAASQLREEIQCECVAVSGVTSQVTARSGAISAISEPCETAIDLGTNRHWKVAEARRISVISTNCSYWNVSHSCRLLLGDETQSPEPLRRVQQDDFESTHELSVTDAMASGNWKIQCSVNQSGVVYRDSESDPRDAPTVFKNADKAIVLVTAQFISSNSYLAVQVIAESKNGRLPIDNVTCQAIFFTRLHNAVTKQHVPMHRAGSNIWSSVFRATRKQCTVRCQALQISLDELVFRTIAETRVSSSQEVIAPKPEQLAPKSGVSTETDGALVSDLCTTHSHLILFGTAAAAVEILVIILVVIVTWQVALVRIRKPLVPAAAVAGMPMYPLPLVGTANTVGPYEQPVSDQGTYSQADSTNEQVIRNATESWFTSSVQRNISTVIPPRPRQPLPRLPTSDSGECHYIN